MSIVIRDISKRFGRHLALSNVSFDVPSGQLVGLLGPSGSGKTTLLRIIAGMESADTGTVTFKDPALAPQRRHHAIGFVFQHDALFRHMTVSENIGFALKVRGRPRQEIQERVAELLRLIQLEGIGSRYPAQLSGGQRQRVALARALAAGPRVLLLDEPFGALDAKVRKELRDWLRRLHERVQLTSVFVTHDQEEALELADRVVVLHRGKIEQEGPTEEVYHHPKNAFVMQFLGQVNLFHGRKIGGELHFGEDGHASGEQVLAFARPHELELRRTPLPGDLLGTISRVNTAGVQARVEVMVAGGDRRIEVLLPLEQFRQAGWSAGDLVAVRPKQVKVFDSLDYSI